MPTSFLVVDDFLDNVDEVRQAALGLTYPEQEGGAFPGRNSMQRLGIEGLDQQVSHLVGEPLRPTEPLQSHAKCRLTLARDMGSEKARVHVDMAHWSGILYLSRPEDCRGGTEFFRHRPTGTDGLAHTPGELARLGFASSREMLARTGIPDSMDRSKWEPTMQVPMRYNRLLLLRPWLWHTAGDGFGSCLQDGRLVYLMFFASARR